MNFQPIIDNFHVILISLGFLLWAIARVIEARAKADPKETWEDQWAGTASMLSEIGAKGIDLLAQVLKARGDNRLANGQAKAVELQRKLATWEEMWRAGKKKDVLTDAWGWYVDLQGKQEKLAAPFVPSPSNRIIPSREDGAIGPDDEAV